MVPELPTKRLELLKEGSLSSRALTSSSNDGLSVAVHESAPGHEAADRGSATSRQMSRGRADPTLGHSPLTLTISLPDEQAGFGLISTGRHAPLTGMPLALRPAN